MAATIASTRPASLPSEKLGTHSTSGPLISPSVCIPRSHVPSPLLATRYSRLPALSFPCTLPESPANNFVRRRSSFPVFLPPERVSHLNLNAGVHARIAVAQRGRGNMHSIHPQIDRPLRPDEEVNSAAALRRKVPYAGAPVNSQG